MNGIFNAGERRHIFMLSMKKTPHAAKQSQNEWRGCEKWMEHGKLERSFISSKTKKKLHHIYLRILKMAIKFCVCVHLSVFYVFLFARHSFHWYSSTRSENMQRIKIDRSTNIASLNILLARMILYKTDRGQWYVRWRHCTFRVNGNMSFIKHSQYSEQWTLSMPRISTATEQQRKDIYLFCTLRKIIAYFFRVFDSVDTVYTNKQAKKKKWRNQNAKPTRWNAMQGRRTVHFFRYDLSAMTATANEIQRISVSASTPIHRQPCCMSGDCKHD